VITTLAIVQLIGDRFLIVNGEGQSWHWEDGPSARDWHCS